MQHIPLASASQEPCEDGSCYAPVAKPRSSPGRPPATATDGCSGTRRADRSLIRLSAVWAHCGAAVNCCKLARSNYETVDVSAYEQVRKTEMRPRRAWRYRADSTF